MITAGNRVVMEGDSDISSALSVTSPTVQARKRRHDRSLKYPGPPVCMACDNVILDQLIFQMQDRYWHSECLKCSVCHVTLTNTCYFEESNIYCEADFFRMFGARCASCSQPIQRTEHVRRAHENIYHLSCFTCVVCNKAIGSGEEFYLRVDKRLICRDDYDTMTGSSRDESDSDSENKVKRKCSSIDEFQLSILKSTFECHSKPSRHYCQKLSVQTGLDVRTIQMWFQDRRIAEKRKKMSFSTENQSVDNCPTLGFSLPEYDPMDNRSHVSFGINLSAFQSAKPNDTTRDKNTPRGCVKYGESFCDVTEFFNLLTSEEMPPNVDLNPEDILNGEVAFPKSVQVTECNRTILISNQRDVDYKELMSTSPESWVK